MGRLWGNRLLQEVILRTLRGYLHQLTFEIVGKLSSRFHGHSVLFLIVRGPEILLSSESLPRPFKDDNWLRFLKRTFFSFRLSGF
jgi:hypothetical protein